MSGKKFNKSKKSDGGNVPNFVFNFSGSQPGSPLASPGGAGFNSTPSSPASTSFNFGSNTSQSGSTFQPFVFGDPLTSAAASPTTGSASGTFKFGSPSSAASIAQLGTKRVQSDLSLLNGPERGSLRKTNSDISFGATAAASTPASTQFTFGSPAASPSTNSNTNLSVGTTTTPTLNTQPSFGSVGSQSSFSTPAPAASTLPTFGSPATSSTGNTASTPSAAAPSAGSSIGGFSFGTPTSSASTGTGTFGKLPSTTAPATSTPTFGFGTSTTDKPAAPTFTFGTSTADKPSTPSATTTAASTSPFTLGSSPSSSTTTTPTGGFSFGKPAATPASTPATSTSTTSTPAATSTTPSFSFGTHTATSKPTENNKPATSTASSTPSFTFGSPKTTSTPTASTGSTTPSFSFGTPASTTATGTSAATSTAATSATAPSSSLFSLGTIGGDKDGKKPGSSVTSAPFTFGASTSATGTTSTPAAAPSIATVDPNKPNAFSFSKILDDLAKIAAQPPNQMYASLITPALAALQQNQVVSHTSFRIDNILHSTRFAELPEQAQKELDELEKYVRLEGQRCEYIGRHKVPQHVKAMDKTKKDTELLSEQLDALSSTLKGQMESIESFYERLKSQLRHASEGCAVIEACKHPGNNARWLFGYTEDDDYFSQVAKELGGRLEEYKRCIWEIERTAESWTHNRVQSPQDIADIMRAQNQAFLSLSNKVSALHESVNVEMNYYNQYLKMYS